MNRTTVYNKSHTYRTRVYLGKKDSKGVILRFKDKKDSEDYTNRMKNVRVKHLGNISPVTKKRKVKSYPGLALNFGVIKPKKSFPGLLSYRNK